MPFGAITKTMAAATGAPAAIIMSTSTIATITSSTPSRVSVPRAGNLEINLEDVPGSLPLCQPTGRTCITGRETRTELASRPGQPSAMPVSGVVPGRPGQGPGERPGTQPAKPGQAAGPKAETRPAQVAKPVQPKVKPAGGPNNVLADKNGNVYKRDNQGNMKPAAKPATRPAAASRPAPRPSVDTRQLNRDYAARQRGEVRTQNFARASASPRPSYSRPSGGGARLPRGQSAFGRRWRSRRRWWRWRWRWRRSRRPALGFRTLEELKRRTMACYGSLAKAAE